MNGKENASFLMKEACDANSFIQHMVIYNFLNNKQQFPDCTPSHILNTSLTGLCLVFNTSYGCFNR